MTGSTLSSPKQVLGQPSLSNFMDSGHYFVLAPTLFKLTSFKMQGSMFEDFHNVPYDWQAPVSEPLILDSRVLFHGLNHQIMGDEDGPTDDNVEVAADFGHEYDPHNNRLVDNDLFQPPFIIVGYHRVILHSPRQLWGNILPEDMVRATNKIYYTDRDMQRWFRLSNANCPTLGNCQWCFRALPMNDHCHICNWRRMQNQERSIIYPSFRNAGGGHLVTFGYLFPPDEPSDCNTHVATLDAQWLSLMLAPWRATPRLPSIDRRCDFGSAPGHFHICANHVINCLIRKWTNFLWGYSFPHGPIDFNPQNSTQPTFWTTLIVEPSIIIKIMNMAFRKDEIRLHRLQGILHDINRWNHDLDLHDDDSDNLINPSNAASRLSSTSACRCIKRFGNLDLPFATQHDAYRYPVDLAITHNSPWQWFPHLSRTSSNPTHAHNPLVPNIDLPDSV